MKRLKICLIEPFFGGSHQRWAEELQAQSRHQIELLALPARHWKWRMHGSAVTLAERLLASDQNFDLLLATDMLDLSVFLSLVRRRYANAPVALYFHENQLSYPWSPLDEDPRLRRDLHYAFINYTSALSADRVYFNSNYHRESFLEALPAFLRRYPDHQNTESVGAMRAKSATLPLAIDLRALDRIGDIESRRAKPHQPPLLLWNHRWEYDKNPEGFCDLLLAAHERGLPFQVAILGQRFEEDPACFAQLRKRLGDRVVAYGGVSDREEYERWLWAADILPVTSVQDFFGGSVVEALHCGCVPLLPQRLAYPEHLDPAVYPELFYSRPEEAVEKLAALIQGGFRERAVSMRAAVSHCDWNRRIGDYDAAFERCCA